MKTVLQQEHQARLSFDNSNSSSKQRDSDSVRSRPSLNQSLASSDLSISAPEVHQRRFSEILCIQGRLSVDEKSYDTQSVKECSDSYLLFGSILHSKNFLLKSKVCQKQSVSAKSSPKEASPVMQYFYPSLLIKSEPKTGSLPQLPPIVISQNGRNYHQKDNGANVSLKPEPIVQVNQSEKVPLQKERVSFGSKSNGGYYPQPNSFAYSNENYQYANFYENEGLDKRTANKFSSVDHSNGLQSFNIKNRSQMPMNNNIFLCENYSNEVLGELSIYLIKEQNGCKLLQKRVKQDRDFANAHLFPNLQKDLCDLICDSFGNYLFQILFEYLSNENLSVLLTGIKGSFSKVCMSPYGTRAIQNLLEVIKSKPELLSQFNQLLTPSLIRSLAEDPQGNYIIQKYIIEIPAPANQFIYEGIKANLLDIAQTKQGCCTIQKCLKDASKAQKEELMSIIYANMFTLITDQFGSYIFQYLIAKESPEVQIKAINLILPKLVTICKRKYSSNAIEKCFETTNEVIQMLLLKHLIENDNWIDELIVDSFGNYVIQKALMVSKGEVYMKMLKVIARNIKRLKQVPFGNKLISILITKHKELGHIIANEQPGIAKENSGSPVYQNYHQGNQRQNGYNLNHNANNKTMRPMKSS